MTEQGINIVGVQFRRSGKIYDFSSDGLAVIVGDHVIVDSDRGPSLAEVVSVRFHHPNEHFEKKLKAIVRVASKKEVNRPARLTPEDVVNFTKEQVDKHSLKMRILRSEVQFGGNKVIVYFTAPGRVDFRELVKDLASGLKTRIELKQIGARDETKLLGGIGICGREYCCSSFLREFVPVSIRMAKNQNLALNPSKVSGGCGRLLCCLTYENDTYSSLRQNLPPIGARVKVPELDLVGKVIRADLLNQLVALGTDDGGQVEVKVDKVEVIDRYTNIGPEAGKSATEDELDPHAEQWADGLDLEVLTDEVSKLDEQSTEPQNKTRNQSRDRNSRGEQGRRHPKSRHQEGEKRPQHKSRDQRSSNKPHRDKPGGGGNPKGRFKRGENQNQQVQGEQRKDREDGNRPYFKKPRNEGSQHNNNRHEKNQPGEEQQGKPRPPHAKGGFKKKHPRNRPKKPNVQGPTNKKSED
ncbi:MAG: regulatory iron-sulfur-containing complex subunit RicT [Oligoflexales bacterium]